MEQINFVTPVDLAKNRGKNILIVDIRDKIKFSQNTVKGSLNIDVYNDLRNGNFDAVIEKLKALPKNKIIITICNAGITAQAASAVLDSMGYKTAVLEHGMLGWNAMGRNNN